MIAILERDAFGSAAERSDAVNAVAVRLAVCGSQFSRAAYCVFQVGSHLDEALSFQTPLKDVRLH